MIKINKKIYLYLFILCVVIAIAGGITLLAIMSGRTDWHIDLSNATPIEILISILGITCAISGLLSAVFIIIYVVKVMKGKGN